MRRAHLAALGALLLASGCDSFDPASLVQSLRVLGMSADPAEIASGEQTRIRALIVDLDPNAAGRPITYEWAICDKLPRPGVDVDDDCFDLDTAPFITPVPAEPDGSAVVTMPQHTLTDLGLPDSTAGLYVPVRLRIRAGAAMITAIHKLRWRNGLQAPNTNPRIESISFIPTEADGELPDMGQIVEPQPLPDDAATPMTLPRGGKLRFRAKALPGSAETYTTLATDITMLDPSQVMTKQTTELVRFFWYASAGRIDPQINGEERPDITLDTSEFASSLDARGGVLDLWLVARDERGGADWMHRTIRVQ